MSEYAQQILREGDELLAELERRERERAERRREQRCIVFTDEHGKSYSKWVTDFVAR